MPIKGLSQRRRWQRAGKIHLGVMVQGQGGKSYPRATDYFVVPPEIGTMPIGDKPKVLPIIFASDSPEEIFPQWYKAYRTGGLFCKGDGESAKRWVDGNLVTRSCTCELLEQGECSPVATLNFFVDGVAGLGVYQIDTSNKQSIMNLNSGLEQFAALFGGLAGIPFLLRLEPTEVQRVANGKTVMTTIFAMRLDSEHGLREIHAWRLKQGAQVAALMPHEDDDEAPADRVLPERAEKIETAEIVPPAPFTAPAPVKDTVGTSGLAETQTPDSPAQEKAAQGARRTRQRRQEPRPVAPVAQEAPAVAVAQPGPAEEGQEMDFGGGEPAVTLARPSIASLAPAATPEVAVTTGGKQVDAATGEVLVGGHPQGSIEACYHLADKVLGIKAENYTLILNYKWREGVASLTPQHLAEEWDLLKDLNKDGCPKHILETVKGAYRVQWSKAKAQADKR